MTKTVKITKTKRGVNVINNEYLEDVGVNLRIDYDDILVVVDSKLTANIDILHRLHSVSVGIGEVDRVQMIIENTDRETLKIEYTVLW